MRIVVNSGVGIQNDRESQIRLYSGLADDAPITNLINVTSFDTLSLFYDLGRLNYTGYRDSLNSFWNFAFTGNWNATPSKNQKTLAQFFLVDNNFRAQVLNSGELNEWATVLVSENIQAQYQKTANQIQTSSVSSINQSSVSGNIFVENAVFEKDVTISGALFANISPNVGSIHIHSGTSNTVIALPGPFVHAQGTYFDGPIMKNFQNLTGTLKYIGQSPFTGVVCCAGAMRSVSLTPNVSVGIFKNDGLFNTGYRLLDNINSAQHWPFQIIRPISMVSGDYVDVKFQNRENTAILILSSVDLVIK
jgi:hypothetical protein